MGSYLAEMETAPGDWSSNELRFASEGEAELIAAIRRRVDDLEANSPEIYEAVEPKWDPFEIEESDNG